MAQRPILHIIDSETRSRARQARTGFELGYHCEIYAELEEFKQRLPTRGIVLLRVNEDEGLVENVLNDLAGGGVWVPVVATSDYPQPRQIVDAIKAGAHDFLSLPLEPERLEQTIAKVDQEAAAFGKARRKMIEARHLIKTLSRRERQVLDWLAQGSSNKTIARELEISPRTVEIHRANMMGKLGAQHAAEAVRLRLEAHLDVAQEVGAA